MNKELKKIIQSDLKRYGYNSENDVPLTIKNTLYGYKYMKVLRLCKYFKEKKSLLFYFYKIKLNQYSKKYGFQISYATQIGKGFYIGHRGTVIINYKAVIGNNVNVAHNVTIGEEVRGKRKGTPTIGNRVWIGANSTIVGNIKIGDDVIIAPNTFVNFDVPSHSLVIGNQAEIKYKEYCTQDYIENIVEE